VSFDDAAWSVTPRQRQRIVAAAEVWLAHNADVAYQDIRFDAMLVAPGRLPRHIATAFRADG
jgi:putative endonuclease